ncbi:anthranilate phosphoribosyltransferase [Thermococcus sp.]
MNYLTKLIEKQDLSFGEAYELFMELKEENEVKIAAYLAAFQTKGYTGEEIAGLAKAMRDSAIRLELGEVADTAGTGGDGSLTINVSTASALILSAFTRVAKHGNTSITSKSGSANVLDAMGINIHLPPEKAREIIEKTNFTFLFAPLYHPALKPIMSVRKILRIKTIFNILGPLANPANPVYQLVGVNSEELLEPVGEALNFLGVRKALVVYGSGIDEISSFKESKVVEVRKGRLESYTVNPRDFGMEPVKPKPCYSSQESAERIKAVLGGNGRRDDRYFILINSATALYASEIASDFKEAVEMVKSILGTSLLEKLEEIARLSI